ncbi:hypothetical protein [Succinivibrio dextrinosolvens]|uniref:hypothetical protein n=1 Tax=Succinivibrio dextrinosolvens TaxID=83771 RepID=UPI002478C39A|nr:hypothetical protein [Succinivibrio dextrinosolvens]
MSEEYRKEASRISDYYFAIYGKHPEVLASLLTEESKKNIHKTFWDGFNSIVESASAVSKIIDKGLSILDYYDKETLNELILDLRAWKATTSEEIAKKIEKEMNK